MQLFRVDRLEDDIVILENDDRTHKDVPVSEFVGDVREGDLVYQLCDGKYQVSPEATAERKKALFDLQKNIFSE